MSTELETLIEYFLKVQDESVRCTFSNNVKTKPGHALTFDSKKILTDGTITFTICPIAQ